MRQGRVSVRTSARVVAYMASLGSVATLALVATFACAPRDPAPKLPAAPTAPPPKLPEEHGPPVEFVLDPEDEAFSADAVTDLALVADCAERTLPRLDVVLSSRDGRRGGDALFFGVLAPWRREGLPAARAATSYLAALLAENDDW